ncbi:MAG: hypothetical protein H7337_09260 [Rhizobacter sp.]|nr:hypothetical protein [Rhizobacter sp.]
MDTPRPANPAPNPSNFADGAQVRAWLKLREEMAELHARLVYLKLMLAMGVRRA